MDRLEVPLDALVFRLHSLPSTAIWTWVAVLTAAVGLWGIRAVGYKTDATPSASPAPSPTKLSVEAKKVVEPLPVEDHRKVAEPIVVRLPSCHEEEVSKPKARFTAYYHAPDNFGVEDEKDADDEEMMQEEKEEAEDWEEEDVVGSVGVTAAPWMVVSRRGDLGWYRYQDLTALNGSVVRLWDAPDRRLTAMSRYPAVSPRSSRGKNGF